MSTESFDRSKPLYRLFLMDDGSREWWAVGPDNAPTHPAEETMIWLLNAYVAQVEWADEFYAAFTQHKKATVYANKVPEFVVPDGCHAVIRGWIVPRDEGSYAKGQIYGDRARRWFDGHPVNTSTIMSGPDADGIIKTRNSIYKLVQPDA